MVELVEVAEVVVLPNKRIKKKLKSLVIVLGCEIGLKMKQHDQHKKVNQTKMNKDIATKQINLSKIIWICSNKKIVHIFKKIVVKMEKRKIINKRQKKTFFG